MDKNIQLEYWQTSFSHTYQFQKSKKLLIIFQEELMYNWSFSKSPSLRKEWNRWRGTFKNHFLRESWNINTSFVSRNQKSFIITYTNTSADFEDNHLKNKTGLPTVLALCRNQKARSQYFTLRTQSVTGYSLPSFTKLLNSSSKLEFIGTSTHAR